jgi:hypothetical protein
VAQEPPPIQFDDVPLDETRRMSRSPRMDPMLYQELQTRMQSLSDQAVRMTIPDGVSQNAMKNRILRLAAELGIPVTIRRLPGGLLFWRSTDEDIQQAKDITQRLHTARQPRQRRARTSRRRRASRGASTQRSHPEGDVR